VTRNEIPKLFDLLEQLHHKFRKSRDKTTVAIWAAVLKPWTYEQVRAAALERARGKEFIDDPSELCAFLPEPADGAGATGRSSGCKRLEAPDEHSYNRMLNDLKPWHELLRSHGLPNAKEARLAGMSFSEWEDMIRKSGVI